MLINSGKTRKNSLPQEACQTWREIQGSVIAMGQQQGIGLVERGGKLLITVSPLSPCRISICWK